MSYEDFASFIDTNKIDLSKFKEPEIKNFF